MQEEKSALGCPVFRTDIAFVLNLYWSDCWNVWTVGPLCKTRDVNKDLRLKDKDQGLEFKNRRQGLSTWPPFTMQQAQMILGESCGQDSLRVTVLHRSASQNYDNMIV